MKTSADIANIIVEKGLESQMDCVINDHVTDLWNCDESCLYELAHGIYDAMSKDDQEDFRYEAAEGEINVFDDPHAYIKQLSSYIIMCHDPQIHIAMEHIQHWNTSANEEIKQALHS